MEGQRKKGGNGGGEASEGGGIAGHNCGEISGQRNRSTQPLSVKVVGGTTYITGSATVTFQEHLRTRPSAEVASFFRRVAELLDVERGMEDYHFKVVNCTGRFRGWQVSVSQPRPTDTSEGPLAVQRCMSCDMDCPLSIGVTGEDDGGLVSRDTILFEDKNVRCWLDAKARPVLIITPTRHMRRLRDLEAEEMEALWQAAARATREYGAGKFKSMVLNHGTSQTHAHLHLKVWLFEEEFRDGLKDKPGIAETIRKLEAWVATLPEEFQGKWWNERPRRDELGGPKRHRAVY